MEYYGMVCNAMVWCGVVWYGVTWCGVVWCALVWCICRDTVWPQRYHPISSHFLSLEYHLISSYLGMNTVCSFTRNASRVEGFACMPWLTGRRGSFLDDMARWVGEGKVKAHQLTSPDIIRYRMRRDPKPLPIAQTFSSM